MVQHCSPKHIQQRVVVPTWPVPTQKDLWGLPGSSWKFMGPEANEAWPGIRCLMGEGNWGPMKQGCNTGVGAGQCSLTGCPLRGEDEAHFSPSTPSPTPCTMQQEGGTYRGSREAARPQAQLQVPRSVPSPKNGVSLDSLTPELPARLDT